MTSVTSPVDDAHYSFKDIISCKLAKLEQELLLAHLDAIHASSCPPLDASAIELFVPLERRDADDQLAVCVSNDHRIRPRLDISQGATDQVDTSAVHSFADVERYACSQQSSTKSQLPDSSDNSNHFIVSNDQAGGFEKRGTSNVTDVASKKRIVRYEASTRTAEGGEIESSVVNVEHCSQERHACEIAPSLSAASASHDSEILQHSAPSHDTQLLRMTPSQDLELRPNWLISNISVMRTCDKGRAAFKVSEILARKLNKRGSRQSTFASLKDFALKATSCRCIINPFSKRWIAWELLGFVFLLYDLVFLPMQVFEMSRNTAFEIISWVTIIYWTITFFCSFFISFRKETGLLSEDPRQILLHYLKGWFALDLFLVCSDWIGIVLTVMVESSDDSLGSARLARMARMGRMIRTLRILRMMRLGELLSLMESLIQSEYAVIYFLIGRNMAQVLLVAHLAACAWFAIGTAGVNKSWLSPLNLKASSVGQQYLYSLGWSLSTLLGSTVIEIAPQSNLEYVCALFILVLGTIVIALVFGSTTAALTRMHEMRSEDRQSEFSLKSYLRQNHISVSLQARVTRYISIARSVHSKRIPSNQVVLLNLLTGPLRLELQLELHSPHLISHKFFKLYYLTNVGAMSELCLTAITCLYLSRYDVLFQTFTQAYHMYFPVSGVMVYRRAKGAKNTRRNARIDQKTSFCEPAIWTKWIHHGGMKALIESQIIQLEVDAFCNITGSHRDVFVQACEYAAEYLSNVKSELSMYDYLWDVPSEVMHPDGHSTSVVLEDANLDILIDAEEMSAELMGSYSDSDSDSEDERMLQSALACLPITLKYSLSSSRHTSL